VVCSQSTSSTQSRSGSLPKNISLGRRRSGRSKCSSVTASSVRSIHLVLTSSGCPRDDQLSISIPERQMRLRKTSRSSIFFGSPSPYLGRRRRSRLEHARELGGDGAPHHQRVTGKNGILSEFRDVAGAIKRCFRTPDPRACSFDSCERLRRRQIVGRLFEPPSARTISNFTRCARSIAGNASSACTHSGGRNRTEIQLSGTTTGFSSARGGGVVVRGLVSTTSSPCAHYHC